MTIRLFVALASLTALIPSAVLAGELEPIIAEFTCGAGANKFELYFAQKQGTSDLIAYRIAKNRSIAVMPTGLKVEAKFDVNTQAIPFDNSVCSYSFEKGSLRTISCDGENSVPKPLKCERSTAIESMR